mmetsp:Transcript_101077/g.179381  ORF Transcript_101077/g.179381 Transcript_101077/m.179381 type:complete len:229 (-) Transcript_101077:1140-1826(-)
MTKSVKASKGSIISRAPARDRQSTRKLPGLRIRQRPGQGLGAIWQVNLVLKVMHRSWQENFALTVVYLLRRLALARLQALPDFHRRGTFISHGRPHLVTAASELTFEMLWMMQPPLLRSQTLGRSVERARAELGILGEEILHPRHQLLHRNAPCSRSRPRPALAFRSVQRGSAWHQREDPDSSSQSPRQAAWMLQLRLPSLRGLSAGSLPRALQVARKMLLTPRQVVQ